jgi:hypothetical protein
MTGVRVEYVGFVNTGLSREYSLRVQDGAALPKTFVLVITNAAFTAHHARFQDAPDICYQKLMAVLSSPEPQKDERIPLSEEDLHHYRHAHAPKPSRRSHAVVGVPNAAVVKDGRL